VTVVDDPRLGLLRYYHHVVGLLSVAEYKALQWTGDRCAPPPSGWGVDLPIPATPPNSSPFFPFWSRLPPAYQQLARWLHHLRTVSSPEPLPTNEDLGMRLFTATLAEAASAGSAPPPDVGAKDPFVWLHHWTVTTMDASAERDPVIMWHGRLRIHSAALWQCSLWSALDSREEPIRLVLSKALPQRCEIREMSASTREKMETIPEFLSEFETWWECSLLGLYPHSEGELTPQRLVEYFDLMRPLRRRRTFMSWVLLRHDVLCCFIARDYLIHCVRQQPALLRAIIQTFAWHEFVRTCIRAMRETRQLINVEGWNVLLGSNSGSSTTG
jgi:hypothetical protein